MSTFSERYTPITGSAGENRIEINDGTVHALTIPNNASAATVASNGAKALYSVNGENPASNYGRPLPDGDEILLTNLAQIENFKIIRESDTTYIYVQFYTNG